jgi:uncharacterized membrane protein
MSTLGLFHTLAAVAAIVIGGVVLCGKKGSRSHVRYGRVYVSAMALLNISALGIYRITGEFGPFHVGALASLATLAAGFIFLRMTGPTGSGLFGHAYCMLWSYAGLLAAAVSEFATHVLDWPASAGVIGASLTVFVVGGLLIHTLGAAAINRVRGGPMVSGGYRKSGRAGAE